MDIDKIKKSFIEFEKHPPVWAYILVGLAIIIFIQFLRVI